MRSLFTTVSLLAVNVMQTVFIVYRNKFWSAKNNFGTWTSNYQNRYPAVFKGTKTATILFKTIFCCDCV